MQRLRMVAVARVGDSFHARLLAARLGSEGIVTQLRGGGLDGPYPVGHIDVLVGAGDLETARELLLADDVESAFEGLADDGPDTAGGPPPDDAAEYRRRSPALWVVVAVVVALVVFAYANTLGFDRPGRGSGQESGDGGLVEAPEGSAVLAPG